MQRATKKAKTGTPLQKAWPPLHVRIVPFPEIFRSTADPPFRINEVYTKKGELECIDILEMDGLHLIRIYEDDYEVYAVRMAGYWRKSVYETQIREAISKRYDTSLYTIRYH